MVMQSPWSKCAGGQQRGRMRFASEATDDIEVKTTSKALNVRVVPWKFVRVKDEGTPLSIYQSYVI